MMKYKKRWMILAVLCFSLVLTLVYFNSANKIITLRLGIFSGSNWGVPNGESYEFYEDVIARFEKKYPGVKVEFQSGLRKEEYADWISKEALKGSAPDVFLVPNEDFSIFAEVGLLKSLTGYTIDDKNFKDDIYYDASYQAGVYKDELYTLPLESVPTLMFVNKTLLEKEGIALPTTKWTWKEFYEICKKVTKDINNDGTLDQYGVFDYGWKEAAFSNDVTLFSKDGQNAYVNSEELEESIDFIRSIQKLSENATITSQQFDEGKVAFCPMQFSQYRAYMPYPWRVKKYSNFEWDCIPLPSGTSGDNTSQVETLSVGMSSTSSHKKLAWELLKMLSQDSKTQGEIFHTSQGVSVVKEVTQSEEAMEAIMKDNPGNSNFKMWVLNDVMQNGRVQPSFKKYNDAMDLIDTEMYRIINSNADVSTQLTALQHNVESILKE